MFVSITGKLEDIFSYFVIINVGGIGYKVNTSSAILKKKLNIGIIIKLYTIVVYRKESQEIYGFYDKESLNFFKKIIENVSGIGPKIALEIMNYLSISVLKKAIIQRDINLLSKCPGIGKKTAGRLVLELKEKIEFDNQQYLKESKVSANKNNKFYSSSLKKDEGVAALIALGYKSFEANQAINIAMEKLQDDNITIENLIRFVLSNSVNKD